MMGGGKRVRVERRVAKTREGREEMERERRGGNGRKSKMCCLISDKLSPPVGG